MTNQQEKTNLVEVYRASNRLEVDRAVAEVLEAEGIEATVLDRSSHILPTPATQSGEFYIVVPEEDAARARELLGEALEDEALDCDEGEIIE